MATAAQQAEVQLTNESGTEAARRVAEQHAQKARRKQALNLQRENILSQRTSNPSRRAALEAALKHIEEQIAALG